jgi:hypothetical protein
MSREYTDTNGDFDNEPLPDGRRTFKVLSVRPHTKGTTKMYFWSLAHKDGEGTQLLLPSMMQELLRVMGATETKKGEFDWETDLMEGKVFDATVSHALDKKGVMRQNMTEFAKSTVTDDDIPF